MTINLAEGIAFLSLIVAIAAAIFAKNSSSKANKIAQENLNIQNGMVELEMRQAIENAKTKLNDIALLMAPLVSKEDAESLDDEAKSTLTYYRKNFNAAIESLLNTYDDACSKYIDGKVDKERFRKTYKYEIRNLLERPDLKEFFDPLTSRYRTIINVYTEWEKLE